MYSYSGICGIARKNITCTRLTQKNKEKKQQMKSIKKNEENFCSKIETTLCCAIRSIMWLTLVPEVNEKLFISLRWNIFLMVFFSG